MACTQTDKSAVTVTNVSPTQLYGKSVGSRRLFVSDNPETISSGFSGGFITLWDDTVSGRSSVSYRVFFWHLNGTGASIKYGLTIGNGSSGSTADTYAVQNLKMAVSVVTNFQAQGRCAAKALLGSTLDTTSPVNSTISPNSLGVIKEWTVPNGQLVGGVMEFDLVNTTSTRAMIYKLRSVAANSTTADLRNNQNAVISTSAPHPRGTWAYSDIQGYTDSALTQPISYTLGSGRQNFSISNGVNDNIMTAATSYNSSQAVSNTGHFGAIYTVSIRLTNTSSLSQTARIYLNARGGAYSGAVRFNAGTTYGVPTIYASTGAVQVADVSVGPGSSTTVPVQVVHAGGYSLPASILIETL